MKQTMEIKPWKKNFVFVVKKYVSIKPQTVWETKRL